jgi:alpha-beta hydrolase superfamily lysophospholipase
MRSAIALLAALLGGCGLYRGFVYPAPEEAPPKLIADFEPIETCARDGARVHAYLLAAPDARAPVVVLLHGNGETMEHRAGLARDLRAMGYGVALVEYRGYGLSKEAPPPDERGLYLDTSAVLEALAARGVGSDRVVLLGISLGTGVAAQMAACGAARALVLVSPFTSLTDAAHHVVSWLPTGWLVPDRYDTLAKAPRIAVPTLVVHGDADDLIPIEMGRQVAAAIPRAELKVVHGAHHNDLLGLWRRPFLDAVAEFLARSSRPASRHP